MRTEAEIVRHYQESKNNDFFGFWADVLLCRLSAEMLRQFVKPDVDLSDWEQAPNDRESLVAEMKDYMSFAWEKVANHRGISASRSIEKMRAWLWLLGDDDALAFANHAACYAQYGAPILAHISKKYGFDIPEGTEIANMIAGHPCREGCDQGCEE